MTSDANKKHAHKLVFEARSLLQQVDSLAQVREAAEEAVRLLDQAIQFDSNNVEAWNGRGIVKAMFGNYEEAIIDLDKAIQINPKNARYYRDRGRAKEALGQHEAAKADFQKAKELDPDVGQ